jgi:hypothetical protein
MFKILSKTFLCFFLFNVLFISFALAQDVKVSAKLENDNIQIGQEAKLILSVSYKVDNGKDIRIQFPAIVDTIRKEIEVNNQSKIDTIIPDKNKPFEFVQTKTLYITSFDSGYWAIPPFAFTVNNDTTPLLTEALLFHVGSVQVDTTAAIKDIKPPFDESYSFIDWLKDNKYLVMGVALAIVLLIIAYKQYRKYLRNKKNVVVVEKPIIPAHIIAIEKLEKLRNQKLWQEGRLKLYHSELSEIIREYIELRYRIQALEQTTEEILFSFKSIAVDDDSLGKLRQLLVLADLVKFAKEQPLPNENEISISNAFDFVNGTKKEQVKEVKE